MKTRKRQWFLAVSTTALIAVITAVISVQGCQVTSYSKTGSGSVVSLSITSAGASGATGLTVASGTNLQLTVQNGDSVLGASEVTWTSSDPNVTVSPTGLVTLPSTNPPATCTITASKDGSSVTLTLNIQAANLASIAVTPTTGQLDSGTTLQLTSIGTYTSASGTFTQDLTSMATWTTSDEGCVAVSNTGVATGVSGGTAAISAIVGNISSNPVSLSVSGKVLVSIDIAPPDDSVVTGKSQYFSATATFDENGVQSTKDVTQSVAWTSSDPTIAQVGVYNTQNAGWAVMGLSAGSVTITAKLGSKTASTSLTVSGPTVKYN